MAPATLSRLAISKVMTLTCTYDHRVIQGAESGVFLARVEQLLLGEHGFYEGIFADLGIPFRPLRWGRTATLDPGRRTRDREAGPGARAHQRLPGARAPDRRHRSASDARNRAPSRARARDHGLTIWDLDREFWTGGLGGDHLPLREIVAVMRRVYCGKIGIEYRLISSPTEKEWIRQRIAAATAVSPCRRRSASACSRSSSPPRQFERFLGTKFLGQSRYSVEGCDTAIPLLDRLVEGAAARGLDEVVIGMSHRGRLNILANVVGNSASGSSPASRASCTPTSPRTRETSSTTRARERSGAPNRGAMSAIEVESNPSHLEFVDPVVEGVVRAKQERARRPRPGGLETRAAGAAARRRGLRRAGHRRRDVQPRATCPDTGRAARFTSSSTTRSDSRRRPPEARSSVYSTDVAKIIQVPIFHVNADDPEAAHRVLQIALDYRQEFHKDVVIDLIGFRRHGHNEGDEPTYTQPLMYQTIEEHPGVRTLYARRLVREGVLTEDEVRDLEARQIARVRGGAVRGEAGRAAAGAPRRGARAATGPSSRWRPACRARRSRASAGSSRPCRPDST